MSLDFEKRVLSHSKTKRSQRFLMMVLAHHADKDGVCWPGVATLANEMNAAPRNINNLLAKIRETGEVIVLEGGGRNHSNIYLITLGQTQADIGRILAIHHRINPDKKDRVYNEGSGGVNPDVLSKKGDEKDRVSNAINPDVPGKNPDVFCINPDENIRGTDNRTDNELNNTTTAAGFDIDFADCLTLYRNNIGNLSQLQIDDFQDVHGGLSPPPAETKYQWFQYAVLEAASNGVNNWKYVKAVIENVSQVGSLAKHKDKRNGQAISSRFSKSENSSSQKAKRGSSTRRQVRRRPDVGRGQTPEMRAKLREAFGQ